MRTHWAPIVLVGAMLSGCAAPALEPTSSGVKLLTTPAPGVSFYDVQIVDRNRFTYVEGRLSQTNRYGGGGAFYGYVNIRVTEPDGREREYVVEPITISRSGRMEHGLGYQHLRRSAHFEVRLEHALPKGSEVTVTYRS